MHRLNYDPMYAAKRAQEMHELAVRMQQIADNHTLPVKLRTTCTEHCARAKHLAVVYDGFIGR